MNKTTNTKENGFEKHIVDYLIDSNNYVERENTDYDNINCVDEDLLFQFLEDTQAKALEKLKRYHKDLYRQKIVKLDIPVMLTPIPVILTPLLILV